MNYEGGVLCAFSERRRSSRKFLMLYQAGSQSPCPLPSDKMDRPTCIAMQGRAMFAVKRGSLWLFGAYSVLSATTGSLRAAEEAGIRPEMSVSAMLSRTSRAA